MQILGKSYVCNFGQEIITGYIQIFGELSWDGRIDREAWRGNKGALEVGGLAGSEGVMERLGKWKGSGGLVRGIGRAVGGIVRGTVWFHGEE